ncbi:hypothetical protein BDQ17DRAFT_266759 [Cyathus striatus]|nr:hypothetical protein BDQ17DRAFT_266759 [Cyathus striatus]
MSTAQSGRYAVPHNASPLSASHLPGGYPIPSSASRSCGLDHVLHGECDDSCTHGHHLSPEEIPDYTYGDSRPVISRRSSYMREEERRRNDDDGSFRRLSSSSSSNPMSMPRRSPNVVVNEPVMGSWKVRTNSRRPSEPHHVHPRIYQNHFHPLGWDLSSYVGDHTDSLHYVRSEGENRPREWIPMSKITILMKLIYSRRRKKRCCL